MLLLDDFWNMEQHGTTWNNMIILHGTTALRWPKWKPQDRGTSTAGALRDWSETVFRTGGSWLHHDLSKMNFLSKIAAWLVVI